MFGIVQLEAMACRKTVINTSLNTGVPEVSLHKKTGLTVPPGDASRLASAINELHSNKKLRGEMGNAARERVRRHFDHKVMIQRIESLYEELV